MKHVLLILSCYLYVTLICHSSFTKLNYAYVDNFFLLPYSRVILLSFGSLVGAHTHTYITFNPVHSNLIMAAHHLKFVVNLVLSVHSRLPDEVCHRESDLTIQWLDPSSWCATLDDLSILYNVSQEYLCVALSGAFQVIR